MHAKSFWIHIVSSMIVWIVQQKLTQGRLQNHKQNMRFNGIFPKKTSLTIWILSLKEDYGKPIIGPKHEHAFRKVSEKENPQVVDSRTKRVKLQPRNTCSKDEKRMF